MRECADELAEAKAVVVLADKPAHSVHTAIEHVAPLAELGRGDVALGQSFRDGVGGQLTRLQGQQYAGGIQRIEKPKRVADQYPAVASDLLGTVRVVLGGEVPSATLADRHALFDGWAGLHLLVVRLLMAAPAFEQVVKRGHHADADGVVVLWDVPKPA